MKNEQAIQKLEQLEACLVNKLLHKLEKMEHDRDRGILFGDNELTHLHEMVKLAHQIRSFVGVA